MAGTERTDEVELRHTFQTLLGDAGREPLLSELYHENSKQVRCDLGLYQRIQYFNESETGFLLVQRAAKQYACADTVELPQPAPPHSMSIAGAIEARVTSRTFAGGPVGLDQVSTLLKYANGVLDSTRADTLPRRAIPSGGGLYPTELYVLPLSVPSLGPGAYHYDVFHHRLRRFHGKPAEPALGSAGYLGGALGTAAVAFAISACFERQSVKYRERAYRFTLMEAGHLAQNLLLVGTALGLGTLPVGGFLDDELNRYLGLDGVKESLLYLVMMGTLPGGAG
jgi:SagB-type dehydrogenase family enzyme